MSGCPRARTHRTKTESTTQTASAPARTGSSDRRTSVRAGRSRGATAETHQGGDMNGSTSLRAGVLALAIFLTVPLHGPAAGAGLDPSSTWPMFHRDLHHTARTANALPASPQIAWNRMLSDSVEFSSPVIAGDGTIYVGDQGKELWALWPWGLPKWNVHTGGNLRYSTPAVGADSTIYIGSADGKLY